MARKSEKDMINEAKYKLTSKGFKVEEKNKLTCNCCNGSKSVDQSNYFLSFSPIHKGCIATQKIKKNNETVEEERSFVPICKKCLETLLGDADDDKLMYVLEKLDRPYINETWKNVREKYNGRVVKPMTLLGNYLSNVALNHKDLLFRDGEQPNFKGKEVEINEIKQKKLSKAKKEELLKIWGAFPDEDLIYLDNEYQDWATRYTLDTKSMEVLIGQICQTQLEIKREREEGNSVNKQVKDLQDLMNSSALKPIQESAAMSNEANTLGVWIKKIENEEPISEVKEEYKDVDGIGKLIRIFFLGHFNKMLGIKNELSEEYEKEMALYTVSLEESDD